MVTCTELVPIHDPTAVLNLSNDAPGTTTTMVAKVVTNANNKRCIGIMICGILHWL